VVLVVVALAAGAVAAAVWAQRSEGGEGAGSSATTEAPATTDPGATTTESTTTTTEPPRRTATIAFGGDVLIHEPVWEAAAVDGGYDFGPMLAPIRPILAAADLALCHLEVTLAREGQAPTGYPRFRAPGQLADALAGAGFAGCSVASNHSLDHGEAGVAATLDALDAAGLGHVGTARTPEEDRAPRLYDAGGIAVGHLSYSYGFNGLRPPAGKEWLVDAIDPARILEDAAALRAAGAELVVVSLHWGNEYAHGITAAQREVAEALAAVPGAVDLVVGHHAHVVQPISKVGDLWVVWGLGNLLSNNSPRCCTVVATDGLVVTARIGDREDGTGVEVQAITYTPTWNERDGFRVLPAAETLLGDVEPTLAEALRSSWQRTHELVQSLNPDGALPIHPSATP